LTMFLIKKHCKYVDTVDGCYLYITDVYYTGKYFIPIFILSHIIIYVDTRHTLAYSHASLISQFAFNHSKYVFNQIYFA
jgi:hypothetical protein